MKKKGMILASETLKMVLAIICLGFLIYLLTAIYFSNVNGKKLVEANAVLDRISDIISHSDSTNFSSEKVTELTPAGWSIFSYTQDVKPNSCAGFSCLCICDPITVIEFVGRTQQKECDDDGSCLIIQNLMEFEEIEIGGADDSTNIEIFKQGSWLGVKKI
jgi:hypothetical protein